MTVDLGAFTPEDLRAAARFECKILGRKDDFGEGPVPGRKDEGPRPDGKNRSRDTNPNLDLELNPLPVPDDFE